jgi:UDP-N-acetylglucosamine acyltransferase
MRAKKISSLKPHSDNMSLNSVSKKAKIGDNVTIGDFTVIKDDVEIGDNVEIGSGVIIDNGARISDNVKIFHGAIISVPPQDLNYAAKPTTTEIGENTVIREYASVNRGSHTEKTSIGKNCYLMEYTHVAHDCRIGNHVIMANLATLGGHVEVDDYAIFGGLSHVHQFCRIGRNVLIGGGAGFSKDIPPFIIIANIPPKYTGLNNIGLRRNGFTSERIAAIKNAYDVIYSSVYNVSDAIKIIKQEHVLTEDVNIIISFIELSKRGIIKG